MNQTTRYRRAAIAAAALTAALSLACCANTPNTTTAPSAGSTPAAAGGQVLPVATNPIQNNSTVDALTIDSVLVENNVDATGKTVDDHLEIAVTNTGPAALTNFEVFYSFADQTTQANENYYLALPATFTVSPGASRTIHFDNTGAPDHFPVNSYSLYATSKNQLDVSVTVSATDAKPVTATITKDAGGYEQAD